MILADTLKSIIKEVPDFPKPGISFKDITPILSKPEYFDDIIEALLTPFSHLEIDAVAGIESRGFLFGIGMAKKLNVPFIPIRKQGKLPRATYQSSYDLEYGQATIELHKEDISPEANILVHDDLLATGGTARATKDLISQAKANSIGFSFLIELDFLKGRQSLEQESFVSSIVHY